MVKGRLTVRAIIREVVQKVTIKITMIAIVARMGMSDRIIVLAEGDMTGELSKEEFSQERIMAFASAANVEEV